MAKNLVIVESPTKAKTLTPILGKEYEVVSSFGHVRDLPKKTLGIEIDKEFEPKYVVPFKAKTVLKQIKERMEGTEKLILATDPDREGEAIAWHLLQTLKPKQGYVRITFHEITSSAILGAL